MACATLTITPTLFVSTNDVSGLTGEARLPIANLRVSGNHPFRKVSDQLAVWAEGETFIRMLGGCK